MLDIKQIRTDTDRLTAALLKRMDSVDFSEILRLDDRRRALIAQAESARAERNALAKKIGQARAQKTDSSELEKTASGLADVVAGAEKSVAEIETQLNDLLASLPNVPDDRVPAGDKEQNQVVRVWGEKPTPVPNAADHVTLCRRLGLVDYERGTKIGGSGFWLYTGMGAALEWALLDYFCREHFRDGYTFFLPPHLLTYECGYAAGQFPKFEDAVFHLRTTGHDRERFLLPTAETAVLNVYRDEILDLQTLPIKCFAYSPCYRREGGAHRTEERGTIRGHQFNKVEMFQFTTPEQAEAAIHELVRRAETILENLGLHYRTTLLAAMDMSSAMAMTYDVEVWIPSMQVYKEVSSVSWARDFQARRANIRFKPEGRKQNEYIHTLNGSGLATSRLLPAIVEQMQQADGSVRVPEPLRPWLGVETIRVPGATS